MNIIDKISEFAFDSEKWGKIKIPAEQLRKEQAWRLPAAFVSYVALYAKGVWMNEKNLQQLPYIVNLAPRMLRGVESQGMLLAASDENGVALIFPERNVENGTRLR